MLLRLGLLLKIPMIMDAEFDRCTAYGLKAGTHREETSQAPEATNTSGATVSTLSNFICKIELCRKVALFNLLPSAPRYLSVHCFHASRLNTLFQNQQINTEKI